MPPQSTRPFFHRLIDRSTDFNAALRGVEQIEAVTALARLETNEPTIWVDVRSRSEQAVSTLPGAITSREAWEQLAQLQSPDTPLIIAYCTAGWRSGSFVSKLRRRGVKALNLRGGLFSWCHAQGPLVDPSGEATRRVHTYGRYCQFVPENYEPTC